MLKRQASPTSAELNRVKTTLEQTPVLLAEQKVNMTDSLLTSGELILLFIMLPHLGFILLSLTRFFSCNVEQADLKSKY